MNDDFYYVLGVDLEPDHYQVLGVHPTDDLATIKQALRKKALDNHPDRGGTVEAMQRINYAWEILSHPDKRSRYDELRKNPGSTVALYAANQDAQSVRSQAEGFARKWEDYESWLNALSSDFSGATYDQVLLDKNGLSFPVIRGSYSGVLFIALGVVASGWFAGLPAYNWLTEKVYKKFHIVPVAAVGLIILGGAWLGSGVHQAISESFHKTPPNSKQTSAAPAQSTNRIIACSKCHQKLRIPSSEEELIVTCTKCRNQFTCKPVST